MAQMTALRRRMIDDMTVRNLSPATQQSYVYAVAKFSRFSAVRRISWGSRRFAPTSFTWPGSAGRGRTSTRCRAHCASSSA
jgi:hypothetical protein